MSKGGINIKNSANRSDLQAFRKMDKILEKLMVNANDSRTKYQIIFPIQKTCIDLYVLEYVNYKLMRRQIIQTIFI